jgi:hypothetical protein
VAVARCAELQSRLLAAFAAYNHIRRTGRAPASLLDAAGVPRGSRQLAFAWLRVAADGGAMAFRDALRPLRLDDASDAEFDLLTATHDLAELSEADADTIARIRGRMAHVVYGVKDGQQRRLRKSGCPR